MKKHLFFLALLSSTIHASFISSGSGVGSSPTIGGPVIGGDQYSVLFVNPDETLAQDNPGFTYDPATGMLISGDLTLSNLNTGVCHVDSGGLLSSSLIINADVDAAAAIAGTKISPNFGSQNVTTTGSGTFNGLTASNLGAGIAHISSGGVFSSSAVNLTSEVTGTLPFGNGGTGTTSIVSGLVRSNGTALSGGATVALGSEVSGTLPVGNGGTGVTSLSDILGTANQVSVSGGTARVIGGNVTLSLPQDIATTSDVTFDEIIGTTRVATPNIEATTSAGLLFEANSGTDIATFGAGGGSQAVFEGALESKTSLILEDPGAGTNNITLRAPTLAGNSVYDLPTAVPTLGGQTLSSTTAGVMSWSGPPSSSNQITNVSLNATVASNALTIALKNSANSDCSTSSPCYIGFGDSSLTNGQYNQRSITSSLSLTISSGSTLGHDNGYTQYIYIYAIDSGSGVVLGAVTSPQFGPSGWASTTAEGGAGGADSRTTMYSVAAQTTKPYQLIGRITISETTAGTWATAPTELKLLPVFIDPSPIMVSAIVANNGSTCAITNEIGPVNAVDWLTSCVRSSGTCTCSINSNIFSAAPNCTAVNSAGSGNDNMVKIESAPTTTTVVFSGTVANTGVSANATATLQCHGLR